LPKNLFPNSSPLANSLVDIQIWSDVKKKHNDISSKKTWEKLFKRRRTRKKKEQNKKNKKNTRNKMGLDLEL